MSNGKFLKLDPPKQNSASLGYSFVSVADPEGALDYKFNALQGDKQGTVVPLTNRKGQLDGTQDVFGKIMVGKTFSYKDGSLVSEKSFIPSHLGMSEEALGKDNAKKEETAEEEISKEEVFEQDMSAEDTENDLAAIVASLSDQKIPQDSSMVDLNSLFQLFQKSSLDKSSTQGTSVKKKKDPIKKVKLEGSFGSYRGTYLYFYEEDPFIILVYGRDAQVFTPPKSDSEFELTCDGKTYRVYFPGIEFELPFADCGLQVMIRSA